MKKHTVFIVILVLVVLVVSVGSVYAIVNDSSNKQVLTEAIKASDVCPTHLLKDCVECTPEKASYRTLCPTCGNDMVVACNDHYYRSPSNPNRAPCYVYDHPSQCVNLQSLCWNYYVCNDCEYSQKGTRADDWHVESYDHLLCNHSVACEDAAYCSMKRVATYIQEWNGPGKGSNDEENAATEKVWTKDFDEAIAAGEYCEIHDCFGCEIYHD